MEVSLFNVSNVNTPCSECKEFSFPISPENLFMYFSGKTIDCPLCGAKLDWWKLLLRHLQWGFPSYLYGLVGAFSTSFIIKMKPNEIFNLDLTELGINKDSKILHINYTPNGNGLFPVELHGNTPIRHFTPHQIHLYGRPFGEPSVETPVAVGVCWIDKKNEDESWQNLIQAIEAFSLGQFHSAIIPANVSVEAKLCETLRNHICKYVGSTHTDDFLETRATYSSQLNILLPLLANYTSFPKLPDLIRGNLNSLRKYRNELAHKGYIDIELNKENTAALMCSSVFGLGYVNLLEKHLESC